jgi:hypothetical protein
MGCLINIIISNPNVMVKYIKLTKTSISNQDHNEEKENREILYSLFIIYINIRYVIQWKK